GGGEEIEGVGGGPGEHHLVAGPAVEEGGDGPAGALEQVGGELGQVPGAPVDAAVVRRVGGHVVPDPLEGGRAGGLVERRVGHLPAGDERNGDVQPEDGQRGTAGRVGGGVGGDGRGGGGGGNGHGELPYAAGGSPGRAATARARWWGGEEGMRRRGPVALAPSAGPVGPLRGPDPQFAACTPL